MRYSTKFIKRKNIKQWVNNSSYTRPGKTVSISLLPAGKPGIIIY